MGPLQKKKSAWCHAILSNSVCGASRVHAWCSEESIQLAEERQPCKFSTNMPNHAHCCGIKCVNRRNRCKWGICKAEDGSFKKGRLCGAADDEGCKNLSLVCKELSFHRLPSSDQLRKSWTEKLRRVNAPLTSNSYVCGVHFQGGRRQSWDDIPTIFLWTKPKKKRSARVSMSASETWVHNATLKIIKYLECSCGTV